jgi:DNA-binding PucR family transcriptional regulator
VNQNRAGLLADLGGGRVVGLVPVPTSTSDDSVAELVSELKAQGMQVAASARRKDPATLHDAVREAELLLELSAVASASLAGQEETYRLLIGVLLRDPEELASLRAGTISPLAAYDAEHDTELLGTLETFLGHDGSTTETADVMNLHRHTVGYRLSRVQEVSGLSPYESDGRERLSLGLKAHQILEAAERRSRRL